MKPKPLTKDQGFEKLAPLLSRLAKRHSRATGESWAEHFSLACETYCRAYDSWDPEQSMLITWVQIKVQRAFQEEFRERTRDQAHFRKYQGKHQKMEYTPPSFDKADFLAGLSADAREIVGILLGDSWGLFSEALRVSRDRNRKTGSGEAFVPHRNSLQKVVRDFCSGMGWDREKIDQVFTEVRLALVS